MPARKPDDGAALPLVLGAVVLLTTLLLTTLGLVLAGAAPARGDQDAKAAVAAAQAGIDEYIARLNATGGQYWTRGNADATNAAFTTGTPVPGTAAAGASFSYQVLTSTADIARTSRLDLRVRGTSRGTTRTLTATLVPRGFLGYIYFTDFEVGDPDLYAKTVQASRDGRAQADDGAKFRPDPAQVIALCSRYYYAGRGLQRYQGTPYVSYRSGPGKPYLLVQGGTTVPKDEEHLISFFCEEIQWTAGDVVQGPLHSNDALQVQGAVRFSDPATTSSWPGQPANRLWWGSGTPVGPSATPKGYLPSYAPPLALPAGNTELLRYVQPKVDTSPNTDRPGCLYTGATRIRFEGTTMKVLSPNTTSTATPSRCLDVGTRSTEQTKPIPEVVYVRPATGTCTRVGFPATDEHTSGRRTTDYAPCRGTAFVQGQVDGKVTVSAEDDVVVTGNLTLQDGGTDTDVTGLVAGNSVWVYHPVRADGTNLLPDASAVRNIEAAVLSLRHSFIVQNYAVGARLSSVASPSSALRVYGAIAQKFRGPVGTGSAGGDPSTGYLKNYVYDPRLKALQPPYFLSGRDAPWTVVQVSDG